VNGNGLGEVPTWLRGFGWFFNAPWAALMVSACGLKLEGCLQLVFSGRSASPRGGLRHKEGVFWLLLTASLKACSTPWVDNFFAAMDVFSR
jgi:hypothetical protein